MALAIRPHTIKIYRPTESLHGDFEGMPEYELVATIKGLITAPTQSTIWRDWGVEVADGRVAYVPSEVDVKVDDRFEIDTWGVFRVAGVRPRAIEGPCDHISVLLEGVAHA